MLRVCPSLFCPPKKECLTRMKRTDFAAEAANSQDVPVDELTFGSIAIVCARTEVHGCVTG